MNPKSAIPDGDQRPQLADELRDRGVLETYSSHHELLFSSGLSCAFHFLAVLLIPLVGSCALAPDNTPPAVVVAYVAEKDTTSDAAPDPLGQPLETVAPEDVALPEAPESPEVQEVTRPELETIAEETDEQLQRELETERGEAAAAAEKAVASLAEARDRLNDRLSQGDPAGANSEGRPGRAARWILRFNTRSSRDYLNQFEGLGAEIAFPLAEERWRYYSDLDSRSPTSEVRTLDRENRIYWIDDDHRAVAGVAREVGFGSTPPYMTAFLPLDLEEKMLRLELAFKGAQSEDDIEQTIFVVVRRGGGYDVQVLSQRLKNETP